MRAFRVVWRPWDDPAVADQAGPEPDDLDNIGDVTALRREAANRRRELRATEAERDELRVRLDATHRAMVESEAAARFVEPRDVWALVDIDALRGADGLVDLERVHAEFDRIEQDRPHWRKAPEPEPAPERFPAVHHGPRSSPEPPAPSFGAQLKQSLRDRY